MLTETQLADHMSHRVGITFCDFLSEPQVNGWKYIGQWMAHAQKAGKVESQTYVAKQPGWLCCLTCKCSDVQWTAFTCAMQMLLNAFQKYLFSNFDAVLLYDASLPTGPTFSVFPAFLQEKCWLYNLKCFSLLQFISFLHQHLALVLRFTFWLICGS